MRRATLIPHVYPVHEPGMPFFVVRGAAAADAAGAGDVAGGAAGADERAAAGAAGAERDAGGRRAARRWSGSTGGSARELALVATFPQLEYPRRWPAHVQVTGPMEFELPYPDDRAAGGRRAAGAGGAVDGAGSGAAAGAGGARGAGGGAGAGGGDDEPARVGGPLPRRRRTRWWSIGSPTRR